MAYQTGSRPLCVSASGGPPQCAEEALGENFKLSVNNRGEVLIEKRDPKDGRVGIAYWRAGLKSVVFIEREGSTPQWISHATTELLRKWSVQTGERFAK